MVSEGGKIILELDVTSSNEKILKEYKDALEQWKRQHATNKTSRQKRPNTNQRHKEGTISQAKKKP
jgi:hypothetical protein